MELRVYFGDVMRSIGFLSRLPVHARYFEGGQFALTRTVQGFPLAGSLILLPVALFLSVLLALGADPLLSAFLALALQALLTGALHEDGLGDAADGLFGGRDAEHSLTIMKDSRVGSYGVIALILSFGLRAAALAALGESLTPLAAAACLPGVAALSRSLMVWHWSTLPQARPDGVAASAGMPEKQALQTVLITGLLLAVLFILPATSLMALFLMLAVAAAAAATVTAYVRRKIGGHTGDTIGACQQICEVLALASLAAAV